jgi:hypothetical protein
MTLAQLFALAEPLAPATPAAAPAHTEEPAGDIPSLIALSRMPLVG